MVADKGHVFADAEHLFYDALSLESDDNPEVFHFRELL
jgi:hypothetical protein